VALVRCDKVQMANNMLSVIMIFFTVDLDETGAQDKVQR
jgi:hypothetical protein